MRLLIQEYLGMLKEDNELDLVILDLASSMNFDIISGPQKGVRQDGVDVHAIGIDPIDNIKKNFLITIKRGDIDRNIWDAPKQGVRPSLNEIIDSYIPHKITTEDKKLPMKIILCCGGELKQEVQSNWAGFEKNQNYQFELWNGSRLSSLIEKYLLDEHIFFEDIKKSMRRTLVVLSDNNYDLGHFKLMINDLLFSDEWTQIANPKIIESKARKALSTIPVCLGMIYEYSVEANNFKHPLIAAEHCLLRSWDFIQKNKLNLNENIMEKFYSFYDLYFKYSAIYHEKISHNSRLRDGMTIHCQNSYGASEVVFEQLGIISVIGLNQVIWSIHSKDPLALENARTVLETVKQIIKNNSISASPNFDGYSIDICLTAYFLAFMNENEFLKDWFHQIIQRFQFAYMLMGHGFPISTDSIDSFIDLQKEGELSKEEASSISTLLPMISYWCTVLHFEDIYKSILEFTKQGIPHCSLQLWFPKKGIKDHFYTGYAGREFGASEAPIHLPESMDELKKRLANFVKEAKEENYFETDWLDSPPAINMIASRHFRTPVPPFLWLHYEEVIA